MKRDENKKPKDVISAFGAAGLSLAFIVVVISVALWLGGCSAPASDSGDSIMGKLKGGYYSLATTSEEIEQVTIATDRSITTNLIKKTIKSSPAAGAFKVMSGLAREAK